MPVGRKPPTASSEKVGWSLPWEPETVRKWALYLGILAIPAYFWFDYLTGDWGIFGKYGSWRPKGSPTQQAEEEYRKAGFTFPTHYLKSGATAKYAVWTPRNYASSRGKTYPLVVFLHGHGERGTDGVLPLKHALAAALRDELPKWNRDDLEFLAVFPQGVTGCWDPWDEDVAVAMGVVEDVKRAYRVDEDRVVLTGLSNGGAGVWEVAAAYPDLWSALVPVAAFARPECAASVRHIPCWCFHGAEDRTADIGLARGMVRSLKAMGRSAWLTEVPKAKHNIWTVYNRPEMYEWMLAQHRGVPAVSPPKPPPVAPPRR